MAAKHLTEHTLASLRPARSRSRAGSSQLWPWSWLGRGTHRSPMRHRHVSGETSCKGSTTPLAHSSINGSARSCFSPAFIFFLFILVIQSALLWQPGCTGDPEAKRLYDDLLSRYNRLIRPVMNYTDTLTVQLGLKLAQIVDVNLKNQIMTTNIWVEQVWYDYRFKWSPSDYGGVETINVPAEQIWLPDIVLFNNADGNYEVTLITKASLFHTGMVVWNPPALYKSSCQIDVEFFPFDEQSCKMQFGSWTYDGIQVDLQHKDQIMGSNIVPMGINLREFILSVEWDILDVPAIRNEEYYPGTRVPYTDITFNITMRRKTLFYTVNLIIPCVGITFLTVLVFYLPSDSGEKVSLCISILVSLTVFFLLLAEIIPPSSLAVPLLGKYLLFTMILVTLSIIVTVGVLNVHFRNPATHVMAPWVRRVFIHIMPRLLLIRRPQYVPGEGFPPDTFKYPGEEDGLASVDAATAAASGDVFAEPKPEPYGRYSSTGHRSDDIFGHSYDEGTSSRQRKYSPEVEKAIQDVQFIAQHMRDADRDINIVEDWKFVAMVLDRLFLWIFTIACVVGTCGIILQAPALYDDRPALDVKYSGIKRSTKAMGHS